MASWRFTALALLLVGVQSVLCVDDEDAKCDVTKATTCYWSQAKVHSVNILVPKESAQKYPGDVCRSEEELPVASVCEDYYGACEESQKVLFRHKENGYAILRTLLLNKTICKGVELLAACIQKDVMGNCNARFADDYSLLNAEANEKAAQNLSQCLDLALKPCVNIVHDVTRSGYMKKLAAAMNDLYKVPEHPVPTTPTAVPTTPTTTTEISTPVPSAATTSTTHEPMTSTTHEPVTSTTQEPVTSTTHEPVTNATGVPPTTPAPPSAASTAKTVGAFGVVALAWLVRAA